MSDQVDQSSNYSLLPYNLSIRGNIIKDIDVNTMLFINVNNLNQVFTSSNPNNFSDQVLDLFNDGILKEGVLHKYFKIETTSKNVPSVKYLMEYGMYDSNYIDTICKDNTGTMYLGELHTHDEVGIQNKVLKVIFPINLIAEFNVMLIGKVSDESPFHLDNVSYAMSFRGSRVTYSGIGNIIYTNNSTPEFNIDKLMYDIHVSNYSKPHLGQYASLSTSNNSMGNLMTDVRYNEALYGNNIPYKNILMNKDYSVKFLGNYIHGGNLNG